ncbi:bifunctional 4-hydroxy-2-oxoglutarate aldolase/2-dehydro-3-deoxy-phosphogluconate aldolase [Actinokineospora inagensis]|uniref:bifunctional 4-hydroxy-2-oxoglutarate aldolase/2-dehydro-3-deoxy-phosphogluconate aldolase n=1 Tax=Actinokineospora inagensis TaxID=103730 RepID=UPI0004020788|nr:bifunctional 4-hydroxy-2-oxoglutarate aldolase/2-dehydro-3-deoxy-phosphogluconate aldolase [Actinokineospora inagensis]
MLSLLDMSPVVPVVVLDDAAQAVPLANALVRGGVRIIEVTLRTPAALESIRRIAAEVPDAVVGAGTVVTPAQALAVKEAGARFIVTPGSTDAVLDAAASTGLPVLPGAATVTEVLRLAERGYRELKFFPAEAAGGIPFLKSIAGPIPDIRFCPTGGITATTAPAYLALPNVGCVGGSWLTASTDLATVERLAGQASALRANTTA